jgi:hypothetical protein
MIAVSCLSPLNLIPQRQTPVPLSCFFQQSCFLTAFEMAQIEWEGAMHWDCFRANGSGPMLAELTAVIWIAGCYAGQFM